MVRRLIRILLLTSCLLFLISASEPPSFIYADGDPDEVVERGPGPDNPPEPPTGEEPPEELGDPDEIVETGDPLGPPMHQTQGIRGVGQGTAYWLVLEAMQASWLIMR